MNIAVVMGGYSAESQISLQSGQFIVSKLDSSKYNIFEIHIFKEEWYCYLENIKYPIDKSNFSFTKDNEIITFEVIINTIHGSPGEDGQLQAYWNLIGLPYTGCGFYQSALTFNKRDTLSVLSKFEISVAKSVYLSKGDNIDPKNIQTKLGLPMFVKPNQSGSSLGVSMVSTMDDFQKAIDYAFTQDNNILIESYLNGTEVSVGVLKYKSETIVLGITEILSQNNFFDFEAKYLGKSQEITPARISKAIEQRVKDTAIKVYDSLGMSGFSRSDFIIVNDTPFFIEINTNPGLTPQSIFPQQASYAKISFNDLLENEINLALIKK